MRLQAVSECLDGSAEIDHKMIALFITFIIFTLLTAATIIGVFSKICDRMIMTMNKTLNNNIIRLFVHTHMTQ